MDKEIWKSISGYEGIYEISNLGRVKRLSRMIVDTNGREWHIGERIIKTHYDPKSGYLIVGLTKDGLRLYYGVHILVAKAFIPNPDNLPCVNHKDENKRNPNVKNLEWCTYSYNNTYGTVLQRRKKKNDIPLPNNTDGIKMSYQKKKDELFGKRKRHQKYVILIDKEGNEIARYESVSKAAMANGFERHLFLKTKEINGIKTIKGKFFIVETKDNEYIPSGHKGARPDLKGNNAKPVCQYSKNGDFINEYPSASIAAEELGKKSGGDITSCCKKKLKTAYGYIWRYKGDEPPTPFINEAIRKIEQYTFDGELVKTYPSITDAIKALGKGTPTCIGNNLTGRSHSAYGFIWKYKNQ